MKVSEGLTAVNRIEYILSVPTTTIHFPPECFGGSIPLRAGAESAGTAS